MASFQAPPSAWYSSFTRQKSSDRIHVSERTPMGGSMAFSFHCAQRPLLVNEPSRSIQWDDGRYSTSVSIEAGSMPGAFQNSAESSMKGSMTTFHFSFDIESSSRGTSGPASRGLNPRATKPSSVPSRALSQMVSHVASPSCLARWW